MAHEDAGHYAAKHPPGTVPDEAVAAALKERAKDDRITCAAAMEVVGDLGVAPSVAGTALDLLECRIIRCQLGLFGYQPEKKIVRPAENIAGDLLAALREAAPEGSLSCASAWEIAGTLGVAKVDVAAACEALGLKIGPCQLGAF